MARTTGRCARKKKPGAPAPLHTLQGLRALARIESPGGAQIFYFFFGTKKKKKILNPLYPFSQKKVCKVCKPCSTLFTTPLVPRVTPLTSPLTGFTLVHRTPASPIFQQYKTRATEHLGQDEVHMNCWLPRTVEMPPEAGWRMTGRRTCR